MKPIEFPEQNCVFAKDQPEYRPLPAYRANDHEVTVASCWKLNILERILLLFTGRIWLQLMTFGGPLQPQLPSIKKPSMPPLIVRRDRSDVPQQQGRFFA